MDCYVKNPTRQLYLEEKHWEAINKIRSCRTGRLGKAVYECESCGTRHYINRSCKHRFCGLCGVSSTYEWGENTLGGLLRMKHHHLIMTLPSPFRNLSKMNGDLLHSLLFQASSEVVRTWFGARHSLLPGIISVLHTSGSDLKYHPHIHMIVTGGGKCLQSGSYRSLSGNYLCPQRYLGEKLRLCFERLLLSRYKKGDFQVYGSIEKAADLRKWLESIKSKHWIVSIQKPLEDLSQLVGYVGRYTKRCCLSEYKIKSICNGKIRFEINDYKNTARGSRPKKKIIGLDYVEFLDRLFVHVPTKRYRMVRYSGLYSSYHKQQIPKELLGIKEEERVSETKALECLSLKGDYAIYRQGEISRGKEDPLYCTSCGQELVCVGIELERNGKIEIYDDS